MRTLSLESPTRTRTLPIGGRSFAAQMVFSHIVVAMLTCFVSMTLIAVGAAQLSAMTGRHDLLMSLISATTSAWMFGAPDGLPLRGQYGELPGYVLIVSPSGEIIYTSGDTPCQANNYLFECEPELIAPIPQVTEYTRNGQRWVKAAIETRDGQLVIGSLGPFYVEMSQQYGSFVIYGNAPFILIMGGVGALVAVPTALILTRLFARRHTRRLSDITQVSQAFADGNFNQRVHITRHDEIGVLAAQFNTMADVVEQSITNLRDLAQQNATLLEQVERNAMQAERLRLARELHDNLAQRMFSLSLSASVLPNLVTSNPSAAVSQAKQIATLAEDSQLDLRDLIVNLRPTDGGTGGLAEALSLLCDSWSASTEIPVEQNFMLTGEYIPAGLAEIVTRVAGEALANIAKHAEASHVTVSLLEGSHKLTLSITDDGRGFHSNGMPSHGHYGIIGMRERARAVGGVVYIESDTHRGTTVRVVLPLHRELN